MANPYDFDRDGRWSTPERAFTHYGIGGEYRRADSERGGSPSGGGGCGSCLSGCGCAAVLLALLFLLFWMLASCVAS